MDEMKLVLVNAINRGVAKGTGDDVNAAADEIIVELQQVCANTDTYHNFLAWLNNMRLDESRIEDHSDD